jgi:long-chain fatty acid transport protein
MRKGLLTIMLSLLLVSASMAGGFGLYEFGAAASAMGGATVARAWDASTVFYNPAGLAFIEGTNFYGGVTLISANNKWSGAEPIFTGVEAESKAALHTPIGVYFTHNYNNDLAVGIGVTNPYGLGLAWEDDFPGRGIAFNTDLKSFYISPVVSYKLSPELSIGVGLDLVYSMVLLERSAYLFGSTGSAGVEVGKSKLEGTSGLGVGFTVSAMFRTDKAGFGMLYRHSVENKFDGGDATFELYDTYASAVAGALLVDQKANTAITFPNSFNIGAYYKVLDNMGIEVDYQWTGWSVFDQLELEFDDSRLNQVVPEDYHNSNTYRVGVHYDLMDNLQLRAGYIYDETPQPIHSVSPLLPDNSRNDYSVGVGYTMGNMKFDLGYMLVDFGERSTVEDGFGRNENNFNGTYAGVANLFMFSFGMGL